MITIPLTKGYVAVVDDEDAALSRFKWHAYEARFPDGSRRNVYASRGVRLPDGRWTQVQLHRVILGAPAGIDVDHIDHDGLNCRRSNLRLASESQNGANQQRGRANRSGFKGVHRRSATRWRAVIRISGTLRHVGQFATAEEAARAYDAAASAAFGMFACLNFPP